MAGLASVKSGQAAVQYLSRGGAGLLGVSAAGRCLVTAPRRNQDRNLRNLCVIMTLC